MSARKAKRHPKAPVVKAKGHAVAAELSDLRQDLFRAMNLVEVTRLSCEEDDFARTTALEMAHQIIDTVALTLNAIGGEP